MPPSENGLVQLELLGLRFRNEPIDVIYSSDLQRAVTTADAINKYHHVPQFVEKGIREISVGKMDGMDWFKLPGLYPKAAADWNLRPWDFESDGGETMREVYDRVSKSFEKLLSENQGKTMVLVSHGCALRNLICYISGLPLERITELEFGNNTAVTLVECEGDKKTIVYRNDASHLPEEMTKNRKGPFFDLSEVPEEYLK